MNKSIKFCMTLISLILIIILIAPNVSAHRNSEFVYEYNGKTIGKITNPENDYGTYYFPVAEILSAIDSNTKETYLGRVGAYDTSQIIFRESCYEFKLSSKVTIYDKECKTVKGSIDISRKQLFLDNNKVFMPAFIFEDILGEGTTVSLYTDRIIIRTKDYAEDIKENNKVILIKVNDPWMYVNEEIKKLDPQGGSHPVMQDGRTLLPVAAIISEFGGSTVWNAKEQKASITLLNNKVDIWIDKKKALVNGVEKTLDVGPKIIDSRTMVPLRFVSENLGLKIGWDNANLTAGIYYGDFDTIPSSYSSYFKYKEQQKTTEKTVQAEVTYNTTDPLDKKGIRINIGDVVSAEGMFSGSVKDINGSKILVYWDSKSILIPNGDEEFWGLVTGIKYKTNQWLEARTVTVENSGH